MKKILFIIGNGFDLRLGLPTSYPEFLDYYEHIEPISLAQGSTSYQNVKDAKELFFQKMKEKEDSGNEDWKDLEVALGEFTSTLIDKKDFLEFYRDINLSLISYLSAIEKNSKSIFTSELSHYLKQSLLAPYKYLTPREEQYFEKKLRYNDLYVDVISFNYTSCFELLCENTLILGKEYNRPDSQWTFTLNSIQYIHGSLITQDKNPILLGVDNEEQISNEAFKVDQDILDVVVKPIGNDNLGSLADKKCLKIISEATVIYLFGTSLGKTDQTWWTALGERFLADGDVVIVYFIYQKYSTPILPTEIVKFQRKTRQQLMTALGLESKNRDSQNRIFVAINSRMFPELDKETYKQALKKRNIFSK